MSEIRKREGKLKGHRSWFRVSLRRRSLACPHPFLLRSMKPSSRLRFSTQGGNRPCSLSYRVAGGAAARGRAAAHSSTPSHPEETAADAIASTNLGASGEVARGRCQGECRDADGGRSERGQGEAFAAQRVRRRGLGLLLLGGHVVGREKKS